MRRQGPDTTRAHRRCARFGRSCPGSPLCLVALAWALVVPCRALAQTVTLPAVADTTISEANPNKNYGSQATLVLKQGGNRVLVRFDPAAIATAVGSGSLATATLRLYIGGNSGNWGTAGRTVDVYRVDAAWTETGATWNCANDSNPGRSTPDCATQWNGGTAEEEATDTVVITGSSAGWVQFDVTADVQAVLAGVPDYGWLIEKTDEGQPGRLDLVSKEGTATQAPQLVLLSQSATYDTVPPSLAITAPSQPVLVNVPTPAIAVAYSDGGSGVDTSTLHILLDGQELTPGCTVGAQAASCTAPPLAAGRHTIAASLSDRAGNVATAMESLLLVIGPGAGSVTMQVAADTYVTAAAADREHGRATTLQVSKSGPSRALVSFDLSPLTAALAGGSQLVSAQLELSIARNANNWGAAGRPVGVYALTMPWSEGAATWDCPIDTNLDNRQPDCAAPWSGGAFAAAPTATALITRAMTGVVDLDVTGDVAAMLAGTANDGWLLKKVDETLSGRIDFTSKEAATGVAARLMAAFQAPALNTTPSLAISSPSQEEVYNTMPAVAVTYSESGGPGIDTSTLVVALDGTALAGCTAGANSALCPAPVVAPGAHVITASVSDRAGNSAAVSFGFQLALDSTQPIVTIASPPDGSLLTNGATPVVATFSDPAAAIDLASVHLTIDGSDVTPQAAVTAAGLTYTPAVPLASGDHQASVSAGDLAGNRAQATADFSIDASVTSVAIAAPAAGSFVATATPAIQGRYSSSSGGIDPSSVVLQVDGVDVTAAAQVGATSVSFAPTTPLAEGAHIAQLAVADAAGETTSASAQFTIDLTAPAIAVVSPGGTLVSISARPAVSLNYSDGGSGIDLGSLEVTLDGLPAALACTAGAQAAICAPATNLAGGEHTVSASVRDLAGNLGTASASFSLTLDSAPVVAISSPAAGSLLNTPTVTVAGTVTSPAGIGQVSVNGIGATLSGGQFSAVVPLQQGANQIVARAVDALGLTGSASVTATLDSVPPTLMVSTPMDGATVNAASVNVTGLASDGSSTVSVTVNGQFAAVENGAFSLATPVVEGPNPLAVVATDAAGNRTEVDLQVTRFSLPTVTIGAPADLSYVAATTVDVSGTVSDASATVTVNGVPAPLSGTSFTAPNVPLIEGGNTLTATAVSALGHVATATVSVVRDLTPPHLSITSPANGAAVFDSTITVSGLVNDIVTGTVNAGQVSVTVNGLAATVANRSFLAIGVPLTPGSNTITVTAVDQGGNAASASVNVQLVSPAGVPRLRMVSGDGQQGVIATQLPQPLVAQLLDGNGMPVAGGRVAFQLRGNNGTLGSVGGAGRVAVVTTDASGQASVTFTLGTRAGPATQVVTAVAAGFAGPVTFTEGALPGSAALLVVDSGDQQVGVAGQQLPRPLVAVVTDAGFNRLAGVGVDFSVTKGQGQFLNGLDTLTAVSDSDGRLIIPFVLDPAEGIANNVVKAQVSGATNPPTVVFSATGRAAGPAAATSVSGVVLDNSGSPIEGVTLRLLDTSLVAQTNAQGQFTILGAPVGSVVLVVDGSTANRPGSWPDLEYTLITIAGRDNTVNMPIYLLPLDLGNGLPVDETHGGTLTLPEMPGFALQIAPGSVTFPGGGKNGTVSVTVVHSDKVPMVPNFGQQPRLIVTIQPAGARFDPPAQLTMPNVEGLAPGEVTEMYSFDHDLGAFVSIGPATVSDDGSVVVSNPGVGVVKAGWHCDGNPFVQATLADCPVCHACADGVCEPLTGTECDDGNPCTVADTCIFGTCIGIPLVPGTVTILANGEGDPAIVPIGATVQFTAAPKIANCLSPAYHWDFGDGTTSTLATPTHTYPTNGVYGVTLQLTCPPCPSVLAEDSLDVYVVALTGLTVTGATQDHMIGEKEWGVVKGQGPVTVHAQIDPDVEGAEDLIQWSGVTANGLDGQVSTATAVEQMVTATVGTTSKSLDVWVMWATLAFNKCGTQQCDADKLRVPLPPGLATFPDLGPQTYPTVGLEAADGQAEISAALSPNGLSTVLNLGDSGWYFLQRDTYRSCENGSFVDQGNYVDDSPSVGFVQAAPDQDNTIYYIDAPTCGALAAQGKVHHSAEQYNSFLAWATWNGEIASDSLPWYYGAAARVDASNLQVDLNSLGTGQLSIPKTCRYNPVLP